MLKLVVILFWSLHLADPLLSLFSFSFSFLSHFPDSPKKRARCRSTYLPSLAVQLLVFLSLLGLTLLSRALLTFNLAFSFFWSYYYISTSLTLFFSAFDYSFHYCTPAHTYMLANCTDALHPVLHRLCMCRLGSCSPFSNPSSCCLLSSSLPFLLSSFPPLFSPLLLGTPSSPFLYLHFKLGFLP